MLGQALSNPVLRTVFETSHFKPAQLDSLLVKDYARRNDIKIKEVLHLKDAPASLGSMERSALQAESVVEKSVGTLVLALSLGLVDYSVVDLIPRIAKVVEESKLRPLDDVEADRLLDLVKAIIKRSSRK